MKAIIAEIDKKQMIVITDKGDFIRVKRQMSAGIGDEIELKPQKTYLTYRKLAGMAACFLACIFLSTGVYAYYTPYSYVSVDINPSIALSLNRFEKVISVNPLNEDAVNLIKDTKNLKNQDIDEALSEIIKSASDKGYINEESENQVMVVVSTKDPKQEKELKKTVTAAAAKELSKVNDNYGVMVEKTSVESYKDALSNKVSPGKEILADKLREVIPEIKDEEIKDMSVKEAVHLINEGRKAVKAAEKDNKGKGKDKDKDEDKDKDKNKNMNEHAVNNKDNEKQNGKEAGKAAAEAKDKKKKDEKTKPAAATIKKNDDAKSKDNEKVTNTQEDKGEQDKDKEEEQKKKDQIDRNDDKGNTGAIENKDKDNAGMGDKDKDNAGSEREDNDDGKKSGSKGSEKEKNKGENSD